MYCNPNYSCEGRVQSSLKSIDIVTQFNILYNSIKKYWTNFEYNITLFHNKNIIWSEYDWNRIINLDIDIIGVDEADHPSVPWQTRIPCFKHKLKYEGTHRLVLDCDMIAVGAPEFDLTCDWQAMFSLDAFSPRRSLNMVKLPLPYGKTPLFRHNNERVSFDDCLKETITNLNLIKNFMKSKSIQLPPHIENETTEMLLNNKCEKEFLQVRYHLGESDRWKSFFPHFNFGALLIKEELATKFADMFVIGYELINVFPIVHCELEFFGSYCLRILSDNWKPFKPGFNMCSGLFGDKQIEEFMNNNQLSLVHYAVTPVHPNAWQRLDKLCKHYFD
jgi:hypothetical protein